MRNHPKITFEHESHRGDVEGRRLTVWHAASSAMRVLQSEFGNGVVTTQPNVPATYSHVSEEPAKLRAASQFATQTATGLNPLMSQAEQQPSQREQQIASAEQLINEIHNESAA